MKTPKLLQCLSRIVLALVFMLGMGISSVLAADIYVSSTNGSNAFDGSQATVGAGGAGPVQTIAYALTIANAGDRIIIEAGAYGTGAALNVGTAVTFEVTPAGAVTAATFNGALNINANVTFDTGAETFNPNGNLTVGAGATLTLGAGDLVLTTGVTVTMTGAANTGAAGSSNVALNAPVFGANTNVTYTLGGVAGLELPANLRNGAVAINGGASMTFPNAFTVNNAAPGADIVWGVGVPTTFNGNVTVAALNVLNPAQTTTFTAGLTATAGNVTHGVGAGNLSMNNVALGGNRLVQANAGGPGAPSMTSTGTVTFVSNVANDDAVDNSAGGIMSLTNVAFSGLSAAAATDVTRDINNAGTMTISGTITSQSVAVIAPGAGVNDVDADIDNTGILTVGGAATVETITNTGVPSTATFNGATTVNGDGAVAAVAPRTNNMAILNTGAGTTLAINANSTVNGDISNTATMNLGGATVLTLTDDTDFTQIGTIGGATGTVNVTGDGAFTGVVDVGGNMILAGVAGVGNNFNFVPVAPAPGNDIDGQLTVNWITTITGPVTAGSIVNGATGNIIIPAGSTLTCESSFNDSLGGAFAAATGTSTLAFALLADGTYTPGPNRVVDNLTVTGANRTLTIAQSIAVNVLFNVGANATVNLTDRLVRMVTAGGTVNVAGTGLLTATSNSGALSFENIGQTITGLGTFTNIVINDQTGAAGAALALGASISVTGQLSLFNGFAVGHALNLAGNNLNMVAPDATIQRRMGIAGAPVTPTNSLIVDLVPPPGNGAVIGNWNLRHYGPIPPAPNDVTGLEFALAGVNNWDIATTGTPLIVVAAGAATMTGNVTVRDNANAQFPAQLFTINGALTVEGEQSTPAVAPIGGVISDAGAGAAFTLNGATQAHTVAGQVLANGPFTVSGNNATLTGSATIGANIAELNNLIVEGVGVVVTTLQQINGALTVGAANTLATLSIGMTQDTTPSTDAENGTVTGLITANGAGLTLTTNVAATLAASPAVAHNRGPINFGAFNLLLSGAGGGHVIPALNPNGASFTATTGALVANAANNIIDLEGADIPNLTAAVALATLASNCTVSTLLTVNANMGGALGTEVLTLSGNANFAAGTTFGPVGNLATINAVGTDFTNTGAAVGGDVATIATLGINSPNPPTTNFISAAGGADTWIITTNYNHVAGDVNLNGNDLQLNGGTFTYAGLGTYSMTGDGEVIFNGAALNTSNTDLIIPHVDVRAVTLINDDDILSIPNGGTLDLTAGVLQIENVPAAGGGNGALNLGDGCTINGNGGTINNRLVGAPNPVVDPTYGININNIYNVAYGATTMELAPDIGLLQINAPVTFAGAETPTVNVMDLNAILTMVVTSSVSMDDGGTVQVSTDVGNIGGFGPTSWIPAGGPLGTILTFDATAAIPAAAVPPTITTNGVWPAAAPITQLNVNWATGLHANRTAQNAAINQPFALGGNTMNFTGNVGMGAAGTFNAQNGVATAVGTVSTFQLGGTTPQTFTVQPGGLVFQVGTDGNGDGDYVDVGDIAPTAFTLNNAAGATLAGGNVTMANTGGTAPVAGREAMANFTAGVLQTGNNVFTIAHYNTLNQGHAQGATGGIFGFARKEIVVQFNFGAAPANRKAFPMATLAGARRDMAITFDDPSQVAPAGARSGIFLTVQFDGTTAPDGNNNMPLDTINGAPLVDRNGQPLTVARYSPEAWVVISSVALSPAVDYNWEGHMAGYTDYVNEDIERTIGLRQEVEVNPLPGVESDNFWFPLGQGSAHTNFQAAPDNPTVRVTDASGALLAVPGTKFTFGLESNMAVLDPCPQCTVNINNGQPPVVIDLTAIVTGGTQPHTYTVTNNDAAVATGAEAGGNLTVTPVGPGAATIDVLVTDHLNDSRTVTITVNVSDALAAAAVTPDPVVLAAAAPGNTWDLDLTTVVTGGAAPYVYAAPVTTDAAVAGGVIAGNVLTVTSAGAGAAIITVVVNDANGAQVAVDVNVTVNTALAVDAAIADFTQQVGAAATTIDLATVFGGGTGTLAFVAVSADETAVLVEITGTTLSVTALTADMDGTPVTVTVTATDDFGTLDEAFDVTRQPLWGDGSVNGEVTAFDATYALQEAAGLITVQAVPLTAMQIWVLDVTGNGAVTAFDGAKILQFSAGIITCFTVEVGCPAKTDVFATGQMGWGEVSVEPTTKTVTLPVAITGDVNDVYSMQFVSQIDMESVTFKAVNADLPEGWQVIHNLTDEGLLSVAMAGTTPINDPGEYVNLMFELLDETAQPTFTADGMVNENASVSFGEVTAREIPTEFALHGNYPNPFNPTTNIKYSLPEGAHVVLEVFDVTGRLVQKLVDGEVEAGHHMVRWDARNAVGVQVASGLYIYRIHAADFVDVKTMLLVK